MGKLINYNLQDGDFVRCEADGRLYVMSKDLGVDPLRPKERIGAYAEVSSAFRPSYEIEDFGCDGCTMCLEPLKPREENLAEMCQSLGAGHELRQAIKRAEAAEKERDELRERLDNELRKNSDYFLKIDKAMEVLNGK